MSGHTPGPWSTYKTNSGWFVDSASSFGPIWAHCGQLEHQEADARLIAAAPDMLAALQDILGFLKGAGYDTRLVKEVIASATTVTERQQS